MALVDIISDTHFDSFFKFCNPKEEEILSLWQSLQPQAQTLVIAGDIGHSNSQNIHVLKTLRRNFYKNIVLVLGNHDYYIDKNEYETREERANEFKERCKKIDGIYLLDGDVVKIDGIKFGGAMGWYDGKYFEQIKDSIGGAKMDMQATWKDTINDNPKMAFDDFLGTETAKIERTLAQEPDVMITHFNPSTKIEHQHPLLANDETTTFYCYDGRRHMEVFDGKYWIFGHSHFSDEFDIDGRFTLMTNCLGYANEKNKGRISTIELY
ncbi:MAG: metallophosphoesterase [Campylobacterales bacterium]|nr:metallophosphoesterase [Campylobacterales bacterium]